MSYARGLSIFLIVFGALQIPTFARAVFVDSNVQCPPGGVVGQPCQDNTHGFITKGTCDSIYVCVANQLDPKQPKNCLSSPGSPDCPRGGITPPLPQTRDIDNMESIRIPASSLPEDFISALQDVFETEGAAETKGKVATSSTDILIEIASGERREGEVLQFSIESFDPTKSELFTRLRDSAVTLSPLAHVGREGTSSPARYAFSSRGVFGGGDYSESESSTQIDSEETITERITNILWQILQILFHVIKAVGYILIADFSSAGLEWKILKEVMRTM